MEIELSSLALKEFSRCLTCLTRFGDDIDIAASPKHLKLSSINSSRSAFGVITFQPTFFGKYELLVPERDRKGMRRARDGDGNEKKGETLRFSVTGKALLAPLRPKSSGSIESCSLSVTSENPGRALDEGEVDTGECRLIVRLHCSHGVIKTHRLTYGSSASLYAKANKGECTSSWIASSRLMRDWIDHFHIKTSATSGGSDEISFYHYGSSLTLRSFTAPVIDGLGTDTSLNSRPIATELVVDVEDFDKYEVQGDPLITFALKEFKAILTLTESTSSAIDVAFQVGGRPIVINTDGDEWHATFVIATTDFSDSGVTSAAAGTGGAPARDENGVKRERNMSAAAQRRHPPSAVAATGRTPGASSTTSGSSSRDSRSYGVPNGTASGSGNGKERKPLFNPPSPSQGSIGGHVEHSFRMDIDGDRQEDDDDEFAGMDDLELNDDDYAAIDRLSQAPPGTLTKNSNVGVEQNNDEDDKDGVNQHLEVDEESLEYVDWGGDRGQTQIGPTPGSPQRPGKKPKWDLFPEDRNGA
ncbi:hypothetical protein T439DRAFT_330033 [Meredithblackwellia eburnea MCA 4105]